MHKPHKNAFDEAEYLKEVAGIDFFGVYEKEAQTVMIASIAGGVGAFLLIAAVVTVVIVKKAKSKKTKAYTTMGISQVKEYVV